MIKSSLTLLLLLMLSACAPAPEKTELSDDYVLIEFAARLEEDYEKIYPEPLDKRTNTPTE